MPLQVFEATCLSKFLRKLRPHASTSSQGYATRQVSRNQEFPVKESSVHDSTSYQGSRSKARVFLNFYDRDNGEETLQENMPIERKFCKEKTPLQIWNGIARTLQQEKNPSQNACKFATKIFPRKTATNLWGNCASRRKTVANLRWKKTSQHRYKFARDLRLDCNEIYLPCNYVAKNR